MYRSLPTLPPGLRKLTVSALFVCACLIFTPACLSAQTTDDTEDVVAIFYQGQDLHEKGDLAGAIALYNKAIEAQPEFPEAYYQCGIARLALGQTTQAEAAFRRALELRADWTLALTNLGSLLVQKNEMAEAERILSKVIGIEPQNSAALAAMAELRLKTGAPPAILQDLLVKVVVLSSKANPTAAIWSTRAALESALGKDASAKASLSQALAVDPQYRPALFQFADIALRESDIVQAAEIAKRLETLAPDANQLNLLKARIRAAEGSLDEAIAFLNLISPVSADSEDLRSKIATIRSTDAAGLEKQLENNGSDPVILGRLCSLLRRDDPQKALTYCRRASEAEPGNIDHAIGFGAALVQARQFDAAVNVLQKIVKAAPDNSTAHANLATALFELGRFNEAKAEYLWLTARRPKLAVAYYFLGIIYDRSTEYMDAMANYQQFVLLADPVENKIDLEKVNLRMPLLQAAIKSGKGKRH